jgi:hypothetical protein
LPTPLQKTHKPIRARQKDYHVSFLRHHQSQKLVFVNPPLPRRVKLLNHRDNIGIGDVVPDLLADPTQVILCDEPLSVDIEQAESATKFLAGVARAHEGASDGLCRGEAEEAVDGRAVLVVRPVGGFLPVAD